MLFDLFIENRAQGNLQYLHPSSTDKHAYLLPQSTAEILVIVVIVRVKAKAFQLETNVV